MPSAAEAFRKIDSFTNALITSMAVLLHLHRLQPIPGLNRLLFQEPCVFDRSGSMMTRLAS